MSKIIGNLQILIRDIENRKIKTYSQTPNIVVYQSGDILAKILGGDMTYAPTHIYGEHSPSEATYPEGSLPTGLTADITDTITTMSGAVDRTTDDAEEPIISKSYNAEQPLTYWSHNMITFTAIIGNSAVNDEMFLGAGLVTVVNSRELLFAHQYHIVLKKLSSFDIIYVWTIKFT